MDRFESLFVVCMSTPLGIGPKAPLQAAPWGIPLNAIGGSGVAKSARIKQCGAIMGLPVYPIFVSTKSPEHIGGFPVWTGEHFTLMCALPQVAAAIRSGSGAILHLDEISSAPPAVQAALLSFINERTMGEFELPPRVRVVLAMNPPDIAANGRDLEIPMANRVLHHAYDPPSLDQWLDYMADEYDPEIPHIANTEQIIADQWRIHFMSVLGSTGSFLKATGGMIKEKDEDGKEVNRSKFYDQPSSDEPRAAGAWPSHRSWHMAVNGVTAARCLGMGISVQTDIVAGLVGKGIAAEWAAYMKKLNLPQPHDVLTWPGGWTVPKQLDVGRIVLRSCASYVVDEKDPKKQLELGISCLDLMRRAAQENGYGDIILKPYKQLISVAGFDLQHTDPRVVQATMDVASMINYSGLTKHIV